jgi:uncharacterized protein (UPF0276 family)
MTGFETALSRRPAPALATTYEGGNPALLERLVPLVDLIEIAPDAIVGSERGQYVLRPEVLDEYASVAPRVGLIAHGIGLSIGSFDHWNHDYLRLLDELFARFDLQWHSEHLGCTVVAGESVGTMFSMPRTQEALDLVSERVDLIQKLYPVPFLLEHIIQLLPDAPADYTPAGFLNAIVSRTGCGLLLDAYNLECDAHNQGLDIAEFLDELDLTAVVEMHLAGGVEVDGFQLDVHSAPTRESTLALARKVVRRAPNLRAVTFEYLKEAIGFLGHDGICAELQRIRQTVLSQAVLQ